MTTISTENLVIIGSGPAGYTAAIYAARANLKPLVFEGFQAGGIPGGQLMTTTDVENFPGFPEGIHGPALMSRMRSQAARWGASLVTEDVIAVDLSQRPLVIKSHHRQVQTHSLIIATGATAKRLHLPSETTYWNRGISACAICDGAAPIFKGVELAVVGGGDTAAEEAIFLTRYGTHIHMLVRRDQLRASKAMQARVFNHPKITVHWHTEPIDVFGDQGQLLGLQVRHTQTGEQSKLAVKGLFYAIGHTPNTALFQGQLDLDEAGYIITPHGSVETSLEGVFAAGDVQDREFRQAITAAGSGCMAAMLAERWLSAQGLEQNDSSEVIAAIVPMESQERVESEERDEVPDLVFTKDLAASFDPNATSHEGGYALRKLFHESDRLLVVKYASPTCGPCHTLKPILNKVVSEFAGHIHYVEIDIEQEPDIAEMGGVVGTPTVQFFRHKELIGELRGVKQKSQYRQMIEQNL